MPSYYRTACESEVAAISAWHTTYGVFDDIDLVDGYGRKRDGDALLWRFDESRETTRLMVERLDRSGLFVRIDEISAHAFWSARSAGV